MTALIPRRQLASPGSICWHCQYTLLYKPQQGRQGTPHERTVHSFTSQTPNTQRTRGGPGRPASLKSSHRLLLRPVISGSPLTACADYGTSSPDPSQGTRRASSTSKAGKDRAVKLKTKLKQKAASSAQASGVDTKAEVEEQDQSVEQPTQKERTFGKWITTFFNIGAEGSDSQKSDAKGKSSEASSGPPAEGRSDGEVSGSKAKAKRAASKTKEARAGKESVTRGEDRGDEDISPTLETAKLEKTRGRKKKASKVKIAKIKTSSKKATKTFPARSKSVDKTTSKASKTMEALGDAKTPPEVVAAMGRQGQALALQPSDLAFEALDIPQPPVPRLAHNLDRVLFNRGVYNLQDRYSGVYNFDPYLERIMPVTEFDWSAIREYKTSSRDKDLAAIAKQHQLRYIGSTSSMTSMLTHFHYLLSHWRGLDFSVLSRGFSIKDPQAGMSFTEVYRAPASIFLRYKNGMYAIDADKEFGTAHVLMALGNSLEKLLTLPPDDFERYRKSDPRGVPLEEREAPQSYHYSKQGNILMRSQLDAYDPRLPGSGVFDLKTRAVLSIRMSARDYENMTGYQILSDFGNYESYEREMYDMFRSTCLKYSLQVRMGRMEGIFLAYHNIEEIFGFQFMNLNFLDKVLHGQEDTCLGDQEFRASLEIVQKIMDQATAEFPETSIKFHFHTKTGVIPMMYVFAEPMGEEQIEESQREAEKSIADFEAELRGNLETATSETSSSQEKSQDTDASAKKSSKASDTPRQLIAWTLTSTNTVNGKKVTRPEKLKPTDKWEIKYDLHRIESASTANSAYAATKKKRKEILVRDDDDDQSASSKGKVDDNAKELGGGLEGQTLAQALAGGASETTRGPSASKKRFDGYLAMLQRLSERGKKIRQERLDKAVGTEKVVVGLDGLAKSEAPGNDATSAPSQADGK